MAARNDVRTLPEDALRTANELIAQGTPHLALAALGEVLTQSKWISRFYWSIGTLEEVMFLFVKLCVELRKIITVRNALNDFRKIVLPVNLKKSLGAVVTEYLIIAEAAAESHEMPVPSNPTSEAKSSYDYMQCPIIFLWHSYHNCLELLKSHTDVEDLYHDIAKSMFNLCQKYSLRGYLRRFCDKLKKHLKEYTKVTPHQKNSVSLIVPKTLKLNFMTRLRQLECAMQLNLWSLVHDTIKDLQSMECNRLPKSMKRFFYEQLAKALWDTGNYLVHAAILLKLFQLNVTAEETARRAVTAVLAVPLLPSTNDKSAELAAMLGFSQPLTRDTLLENLSQSQALKFVPPYLQDLYKCLQDDYEPFLLCPRVKSIIKSLQSSPELAQYIPLLIKVALVSLVGQVSQVYQRIGFTRLIELASQLTTPSDLEGLLLDCAHHNVIMLRIDHLRGCVNFSAIEQQLEARIGLAAQPLSDLILSHFTRLVPGLVRITKLINPLGHKQTIMSSYNEDPNRHAQIVARQQVIDLKIAHCEGLKSDRFWAQLVADRRKEIALDLETRDRLRRMETDRQVFLVTMESDRRERYERECREYHNLIRDERSRRLIERKMNREKESRESWLREQGREVQCHSGKKKEGGNCDGGSLRGSDEADGPSSSGTASRGRSGGRGRGGR